MSLALRAGVPIVTGGPSQEKANIGSRVEWSGVALKISTQRPSVIDLCEAVGCVLSDPAFQTHAQAVAADMTAVHTRAEILAVFDNLIVQSIHPAA